MIWVFYLNLIVGILASCLGFAYKDPLGAWLGGANLMLAFGTICNNKSSTWEIIMEDLGAWIFSCVFIICATVVFVKMIES